MPNAQRMTIFGLLVATSAYVLEIAVFPLLLPEMQRTLGLTISDLALVMNVYATAVAITVLIAGVLEDRLETRVVFILGILLFALGSGLVARAADLNEMLIARLVQGVGGGLFSPAIPVLLASTSSGRPGRALVLWNSFSGFIVAAAPLSAAPVILRIGSDVVPVFLALLALCAAISVWVSVPARAEMSAANLEIEPQQGARLFPNALLLLGFIALNYGTVLLFLFILPLNIIRNGLSPSQAAIPLSLVWVSFTVGGILIRNAIDTPRVVLFLVLSPLCLLLGFSVAVIGDWRVLPALIGAVLVGAGFALGNAPSTALLLRLAARERTLLAASLDVTCARLGSVVLIFLLGRHESETVLLAGVIVACGAGALCALPLRYGFFVRGI